MSHRLPPAAVEALARGDKIEAIKITRQHTGLGLKEAKELVDRHEDGHEGGHGYGHAAAPAAARHAPAASARRPGLAPGEVPRSPLPVGLLVTVAVVAAAVLVYIFRG
jgi:hypothetical protein